MAEWPDNAQGWRDATAVFGIADWDTGVPADAQVVDAEGGSVPRLTPRPRSPATGGGRPAGPGRGGGGPVQLGRVRGRETVDGWQLEANPGTPDVGGLALTAVERATQLAAQRRGEEWE